jgi:salicylate hydroxylase
MQPVIAVIGAGIGGLTAALAFARQGCRVDIFERSPELREAGAGLQLSPNATGVLDALGLSSELSKRWHEPDGLSLVSGTSLRPLANIALGEFAHNRWNHPYAVIHRANLQHVLASAVEAMPQCRLHLGARIEVESESQTLNALAARSGSEPDLLIYADGVWSAKRGTIPGSMPASFTGHVAWRALLDSQEFPGVGHPGNVNAFLGPRAHLVTYPLGSGDVVNMVAVTPGNLSGTEWDIEGDPDVLSVHFRHWSNHLTNVLGRASWHYWPLFEARNNAWHDGTRTVLIGDAAHAMTPHAAQGAAMAIEDAYELASCFKRGDGDVATAIAAFQAIRQPRIDRIRKRGDFNRFAYHARGPVRFARNLTLLARGPDRLAADLDWIFGYRAGKSN